MPPRGHTKERLHKFLAHAGIASRRAAEGMIREGRVTINGEAVERPGVSIDPTRDQVHVDGTLVSVEQPVHFAFNKPPRVLCTSRDAAGRPVVVDFFRNVAQRIYTVGRLDWDAEGLVFVTNDGAFAQQVAHPSNSVAKVYTVEVKGKVRWAGLEQLRRGVREGGELMRVAHVKLLAASAKASRLEVTLHGGKNRQIRRMFKVLGHETVSIMRTAIGAVQLGTLKPGKRRRMTRTEIESFGGTS